MKLRDAKKQASRERVIDAARELFEEVGFQETTVRMIADRAGLSPGGVFTTFDDKVAILCQIVGEQRALLFHTLEKAAPGFEGTTLERVAQVLRIAHAEEHPRLRMLVAYVGASYDWSREFEEDHRRLHRPVERIIRPILKHGVEVGDIRADLDLELFLGMISSLYLRNYRTAHYRDLTCDQLNERVKAQLDILFDGARPR